jgi:hypothetical protein
LCDISQKNKETKEDLGKDGIVTSSRNRLDNLHHEMTKKKEKKNDDDDEEEEEGY